MMQVLWVALGGAVGSVARYGAGLAAARLFGADFPWGTLFVNALGGLAMGTLTARLTPDHEQMRLLIGVGVLGGFTTFSTFSIETVRLLQHQPWTGFTYIAASLVLAVGGCALGLSLARP